MITGCIIKMLDEKSLKFTVAMDVIKTFFALLHFLVTLLFKKLLAV